MAGNGRSQRGLFGSVNHYDENGKKIGHSDPNLFGGYTHYDADGKKTGHSDPGLFGGYRHYDAQGNRTGSSDPGLFGSYHHRDAEGNSTGSSNPGPFGSYRNTSQGCYVATCVYGSYDCPAVWTLRRFRDDILASTAPGRAFIRIYYAVSPAVVKLFGRMGWFHRLWKPVLDRMVRVLNKNGVEDTPYCDTDWRSSGSEG